MASIPKADFVQQLLAAKRRSTKTFSQIAHEMGLTNAYVAQLFHRQAQLPPAYVQALVSAVPQISMGLAERMTEIPLRSFDPAISQDPTIYRLHEAIMHYSESIKAIINEECGDGIMSSVGFYCDVAKVQGVDGEGRMLITFNGKFLPHTVQISANNVADRL